LKSNSAELNFILEEINQFLKDNKIKFTYEHIAKVRLKDGRETSTGGGVAMIFRSDLDWLQIKIPETIMVEAVGLQVKFNEFTTTFFNYYNPPSNDNIDIHFLNWMRAKYKDFLLMGDLNAKTNLCRRQNQAGNSLQDFMVDNECVILNEPGQPTSFWRSNGIETNNILDLIIGTELFYDRLLSYKVLTCSELDPYQYEHYHVPVMCQFKMTRKIKPIESKNEAYNINQANWELFKIILETSSASIELTRNANEIATEASKAIREAAKSSIPLVKKTGRIENLPGFLCNLIKEKNYWTRRFKRTRIQHAKDKMYTLKEAVKYELWKYESTKMENFMKRQGPAPLSTKATWNRINRLRGQARKSIPTIVVDGVSFETDEEKAAVFADRMFKTFNEAPVHGKFDDEFKNQVNDYVRGKKYAHLFHDKNIPKIKLKEVNAAINKLNGKSTFDSSGVSNLFLKKTPQSFRKILVDLFNKVLNDGSMPMNWRLAIIKMLEKKSDDATNVKNYRPISITDCLCRLLERVMLKRFQKFLNDNGIIIASQSGFRSSRSTRDNLIFLVQKVTEAFNRKRRVLAIFFDIEAAFDKVWHEGLILKLIRIKTPYYILNFILDFLSERSFVVKINNAVSRQFPITCGVPQGACLSPTLFAIYINDSPRRESPNNEQTLLFADDTAYIKMYKKKRSVLSTKPTHS